MLLSGCASDAPYAPVSDRTKPPKVTWGYHLVRPGETLYSIAWRYGRDFQELANANNIRSPYTIYPNQKLSLYTPSKSARKSSSAPKAKTSSKPKTKKSATKAVSKPAAKKSKVPVNRGPVRWQWPSRGKVIQYYSSKGQVNKGIDISGKLGEPVKAAGPGRVVYAGSGLLGYGRLLIVKHNSTFLSAYAHNSKMLVKEGDSVKAGQKIAEIGSSGTNRAKLHFEIRKNGKPVNPLQYLPRK
ncbi:peptidoglycan DD-metalloendopeptidase family protein [Aestuariirhabdus sp. Z084]|uniref:peptidoglycan DD-metalloendopeptidase family protein n=1 Tax=Aestuariirhabdus haliotis TaxID=2918751 RepID=UPI00201B4127|nr:peptidoglycan DD-metalloendopeptidase family protein [Aestuariirhabdus haliotis]MCL6416356.1 peptidoglycan DD-metalloendopeptidase family protein [Aestuariirhabdus haliotis]MCL6420345.1 peptidoglycan DD-metalloendopeptidase family protein [Aestuariirhabdus haliotis]